MMISVAIRASRFITRRQYLADFRQNICRRNRRRQEFANSVRLAGYFTPNGK